MAAAEEGRGGATGIGALSQCKRSLPALPISSFVLVLVVVLRPRCAGFPRTRTTTSTRTIELRLHRVVLLTFNIVQSSEDFHAAILVSCSTSALQAAIKAVIIRRPFAVS